VEHTEKGRAGRRADRSHPSGEFRSDERVDLVYLDAPDALAGRQAALPMVGVNDSCTERLDVPVVVE
jgi:hypothetical protein